MIATTARADEPACDLVLEGLVEDDQDGEAVFNVLVEVRDERTGTTHDAISDERGAFRIGGLCPGPHHLLTLADFHEALHRDLTLPSPPLVLQLHEGEDEVVVVKGHALGTDDTRATATIEGEALARTRGLDLAEAISEVPGVVVQQGSADTSKPIIRGQQERRLLTLFDGVRHASQKWGVDHAPELDPFAAHRLRVIRGAAGVRYGPDAIGGVILVEPRPLRTTPGLDGEAHLVGATNGWRGTTAFRLDGAHAELPGFAWRVEGNVSRGAARSTPDYVLGNTASGLWNAGVTLGWTGRKVSLVASYRHHAMRAGVFYGIQNGTPADFEAQLTADVPEGADRWTTSYGIDRPYQQVTHDTVLARLTADVGAGELETAYSLQLNHRTEYEQVRSSIEGPQFDFTLRTHDLATSFTHDRAHVGHVNLQGAVGVTGRYQENVYRGLPLVPNYRRWEAGVYAWERLWTHAFELEVGARYDHRGQTAYLSDDAYRRHTARDTLGPDDCDVTDDVARCALSFDTGSVTLGGLWRAVPDLLALKLDLSSASRFPDVDELYLQGTAPSFPVYALGDPSLGVETSWGGSLTAELDQEWVVLEASGHASYVDDYIQFAPDLADDGTPAFEVISRGAFPRFAYRAVDAVFYGFDGGLTVAPRYALSLAVTTSIVRGREAATGEHLVYVPPDRVATTLTWRPPIFRELTASHVSLTGRYVGEQSRVDPARDLAPPPPAYFLLGASVGATVDLGRVDLDLGLEGTNLLNTRYRDYNSLLRYYADEPGWDLRLRVGIRFDHPHTQRTP